MATASLQLREALVRIYRDQGSVQRLLDTAGVRYAVRGGLIQNEWSEALREAELQGDLLLRLVQVAVDEYPGNSGLLTAAAELGVSPTISQTPRSAARKATELSREGSELATLTATLSTELEIVAPAADWSHERAKSRHTRARRLLQQIQVLLATSEVGDSRSAPSMDSVHARDALENAGLSLRRMLEVLDLLANPRIIGERRAEYSAEYRDAAADLRARLSVIVSDALK